MCCCCCCCRCAHVLPSPAVCSQVGAAGQCRGAAHLGQDANQRQARGSAQMCAACVPCALPVCAAGCGMRRCGACGACVLIVVCCSQADPARHGLADRGAQRCKKNHMNNNDRSDRNHNHNHIQSHHIHIIIIIIITISSILDMSILILMRILIIILLTLTLIITPSCSYS